MITMPPYLSKGDTIGIVCPSGYMPLEKIATCIETLQQWGFKVKMGFTPGNQHHYFSGTDEERLLDLQNMLDDDEVQAVLCARGGYGLSRIIDRVDFKKFQSKPKWVIGYSDVTLLLNHIYRKLNIACAHSPMAGAFNDGNNDSAYVKSLKKLLTGNTMRYTCEPHTLNYPGTVTAELLGGNLAMLCHSIGTSSAIDTRGKILFVEDVGEYVYNIDRMMYQLKRAGWLYKLEGLIVGSFSDTKDTVIPFGKGVYEVIREMVKNYDYPVCYGFPVGHTAENYALKVGVTHTLSVTKNGAKLNEFKETDDY